MQATAEKSISAKKSQQQTDADDPCAEERKRLQDRLREAAENEHQQKEELADAQRRWRAACDERRKPSADGVAAYSERDEAALRARVQSLRHSAHEADRLRGELRENRLFTPEQHARWRKLQSRSRAMAEPARRASIQLNNLSTARADEKRRLDEIKNSDKWDQREREVKDQVADLERTIADLDHQIEQVERVQAMLAEEHQRLNELNREVTNELVVA